MRYAKDAKTSLSAQNYKQSPKRNPKAKIQKQIKAKYLKGKLRSKNERLCH